jgi:DNA-binding SARP family transcriptional activator
MQRYRLNLIGPFGLFSPGGSRIEISSQKAVALIAIVVVSSGGVRARRKLEAMLWGSRAPKQAQDSLRRELFNLRKVLTLSQRNSAKHSTPMTSAVYVTNRLGLHKFPPSRGDRNGGNLSPLGSG